jgi:hypothetical protein
MQYSGNVFCGSVILIYSFVTFFCGLLSFCTSLIVAISFCCCMWILWAFLKDIRNLFMSKNRLLCFPIVECSNANFHICK